MAPRCSRTWAFAIAAVIAIACAALGARREVEHADVEADGRNIVDVGRDVEVVLERGARVSYVRSARLLPGLAGDRVVVDQRAGLVLYRVHGDGSLEIHTRFGRMNARAASFVVDVGAARAGVFDGVVRLDATVVPAGAIVDARGVHAARTRDDEDLLASIRSVPGETLADLEDRLAKLRALRTALAER